MYWFRTFTYIPVQHRYIHEKVLIFQAILYTLTRFTARAEKSHACTKMLGNSASNGNTVFPVPHPTCYTTIQSHNLKSWPFTTPLLLNKSILSWLSSTKFQCCYFNNPERKKSFQGDNCPSGDNYQCLPPKLHVYHLHACCQHPANRNKMNIHANSSWLENDQCSLRKAKEEFKGMQKLWTSVIYANCNIVHLLVHVLVNDRVLQSKE